MVWKQHFTTGISKVSQITRGWKSPRRGLRILMYHAVGTDIPDDSSNIFNIQPDLFKTHIDALVNNNNINLVPLSAPHKNYNTTDVAITFDDGYRDNLYIAAPILCELNIPFTVYVTTDYIGSNNHLYLTKDDVKVLSELPGVTIGSHGKTHTKLTTCSHSVLKDELFTGKHYLEDLLGQKVVSLSYPHGDVDQRVRDVAMDAGYELGTTSRVDINKANQDPLLLNRVHILSYDTSRTLKMKTEGDWDWYRWRDKF